MRKRIHAFAVLSLLAVFLLSVFGGCAKDVAKEQDEMRKAAEKLESQLKDDQVENVELDGDITVMGSLVVNGSKTISGKGTITLAMSATKGIYQDASIWEEEGTVTEADFQNMRETSVLYVGDGASLTLSGSVQIKSQQVGNGVVVGKGGSLLVKEDATLSDGRFCSLYNEGTVTLDGGVFSGAKGYNIINAGEMTVADGDFLGEQSRGNIYTGGSLTISGGQMKKAGAYNLYVADGGTALIKGGTLTGAGKANVAVDTKGELKLTEGASVVSAQAGIVNYGTANLDKATLELNFTNLKNYGTATVKNSDIQKSTGNNIENEESGTITLEETNITNSGADSIVNSKGSVSFDGLLVRRAGGIAIHNRGGSLIGENLVIYGAAGTAVDNVDAPDGKAGNVAIKTVEIKTGGGMNVVQESCHGTMALTDAVFGTTSITNIKLISGNLKLQDFEILGTTSTGAGIWTIGGKLDISDATIKSTKGRGLALAAGEITGENLTFQDVVNSAVDVMNHDNGYSSAKVLLKNISFDGGERENVAVTSRRAELTVDGGSFGKTLGNNVRVTNGKATFHSVKILGNQLAEGGGTNYHGVYLTGGSLVLNNCSIRDPLACAIRNKGGEVKAANLRTYNTPEAAITNAYGTDEKAGNITIDGLKVINAGLGAVKNECSGIFTVKNGEFWESPANQIMVKDGIMNVENTVVHKSKNSGKDYHHNIYMTNGRLNLKSVVLKDSDSSGIRQTGGVIVGENVTVKNAQANGVQMSGGQTILKNSTLENSKRTNVNVTAAGASVILDNTMVNGAGDADNNVNCVYIAPDAEVTLKNGTTLTGSCTRAGVVSEGGQLTIDGAKVYGNATRGVSLQIKTVTDEATGATKEYVPTTVIRNTHIYDNGNGTVTGGGIYNEGTLTVFDSTVEGNRSRSGGGLNLGSKSETALHNVNILNNYCTGAGGGIHVSGGSKISIYGGLIKENRADGNGDGVRVNSPDFYLLEHAKINQDNDVYLERNAFIKTQGEGIGNTSAEPMKVTVVDSTIGTVVVQNSTTDEAVRLNGSILCVDVAGTALPVSPFEVYVMVGTSSDIDWVARIPKGDGTYQYFTSLNAAVNAVPTDGTLTRIEVMKDIVVSSAVDVPQDGNRNILLTDDGKGTYTLTRDFQGLPMIILRTGNKMTVEGSSKDDKNPSLIFDGAGYAAGKDQALIKVGTSNTNSKAALTLNAGVKLTNNQNSDTGGAVRTYGVFVMNGGVIEGNQSTASTGGAVAVQTTGEMTMNGGTIRNNTSKKEGGAIVIYNAGKLTLNDGSIVGNSGTAGGAICMISDDKAGGGKLVINGGIISDNKGTANGGAIFVHYNATLTMNGGAVSGNSGSNGGGIYLHYNKDYGVGKMTMSGGTITGNTSTGNGGGVGMANAANQLVMTGGTVSGNTAKGTGTDIHGAGSVSIQDSANIGSIYLPNGKVIEVTGTLTDRENVTEVKLASYVEGGRVLEGEASVIAAVYSLFAVPDDSGFGIDETGCLVSTGEKVDYEARIVNSDGTWNGYMTLADALSAVPTNGELTRVEIMKDITVSSALDIPQDGNRNILLTDDGKGAYTLTREVTKIPMIILRTGNKMIIEGSSRDDTKPSLIFDGAGLAAAADQHIIKIGTSAANSKASLTLNAGVLLKNNKCTNVGAAIRVFGVLNMNGGVIQGNESTVQGGAISVETTGEMILDGGTIKGNRSAKEGGGIILYEQGRLTMNGGIIAENNGTAGGAVCTMFSKTGGAIMTINGGIIRDNKGTANGGAIFVHSNCLLNMTGGTISSNTGSNGGAVYLHYNKTNGVGSMTMSGGTITGNTSTGNGGGVGMANAANELVMTGGSITGNTSSKLGDNIYVAGSLKMEGDAYSDSIYLVKGKKVSLTGVLRAREGITELILPEYVEGTAVFNGDGTAVSDSCQYFKLPAESGMEIRSDGTLQPASASGTGGEAGSAMRSALEKFVDQARAQIQQLAMEKLQYRNISHYEYA